MPAKLCGFFSGIEQNFESIAGLLESQIAQCWMSFPDSNTDGTDENYFKMDRRLYDVKHLPLSLS